jgi:hypothetical protein
MKCPIENPEISDLCEIWWANNTRACGFFRSSFDMAGRTEKSTSPQQKIGFDTTRQIMGIINTNHYIICCI